MNLIKEELDMQKREFDKKEQSTIRRQQDVNQNQQLIISGKEVRRLTNNTLLGRNWYKNNPNPANHLFDFYPWKVLMQKFDALFGVLPPNPNKLKKRKQQPQFFSNISWDYAHSRYNDCLLDSYNF